jgi:hypothetical protein
LEALSEEREVEREMREVMTTKKKKRRLFSSPLTIEIRWSLLTWPPPPGTFSLSSARPSPPSPWGRSVSSLSERSSRMPR